MQFSFGSGLLWGVPTGGSILTPIRFGALQDVEIDFSADMKDLYGQNQFALDVARGKQKIQGKAKVGIISALTYNNLYFGQTYATGQTQMSYSESVTPTVPGNTVIATNADSPASQAVLHFASTTGVLINDAASGTGIAGGAYVIGVTATTVTLSANNTLDCPSSTSVTFVHQPNATVAQSATFLDDLGVRYASSGNPLIKQPLAPPPLTAGNYSYNSAGQYFFASADVAAGGMLVDYSYTTAGTGGNIVGTNPLMGAAPRFIAEFTNQYEGNSLTLKLYSCIATKLTLPTKNDDYTITELDFGAYANSANQVFYLSTSLQ